MLRTTQQFHPWRFEKEIDLETAITGQMIGSCLVDTFGWFGVSKTPFDFARVAGWRYPPDCRCHSRTEEVSSPPIIGVMGRTSVLSP
jgi:hypothetical protein